MTGKLPHQCHKKDNVNNKTDKSALAKHTSHYDPDKTDDPSIYNIKVNNTTKSSLLSQVREGQSNNDNRADIVCNSKGEWNVGDVRLKMSDLGPDI